MEWTKNQLLELEITDLTDQGAGVGRCDGRVCFVPLAVPGDRVRAKVLKPAKNVVYCRLEEVLSPSPDRVEVDCPVYAQCGGCSLRQIRYEAELRLKEQRVRSALRRIGGLEDLPVAPILGAPSRDGYRNKALLPVGMDKNGKPTLGFYARNTHRVVPCPDCRLQPEVFTRVARAFLAWAETSGNSVYDETAHSGALRRLYLRQGEQTGQVLACVVVNGSRLRGEEELVAALRSAAPELTGILLNEHRERTNVALGRKFRTLWGKETIEDKLCGLTFTLSPLSFYQVNRTQAERLYGLAAEFAGLTGTETLLDLYCGTGTIGLSMAGRARKVVGVEIIPDAVENARQNAAANGIRNAEFLCGDAALAARELADRGERPDVVLLDPPRKGCAPELIETVARDLAPRRVVYVSCDPATLARDLKLFAQRGYRPMQAAPVDMFPATLHVETVVQLSQQKPDTYITVGLDLDELDATSAEKKATYEEIKAWVWEHHQLKVSSLYISQVKRKCGLEVGKNYNLSKSDNPKVPQCPKEKEDAIMEALRAFKMI